jgi:hypothetical protein
MTRHVFNDLARMRAPDSQQATLASIRPALQARFVLLALPLGAGAW